MKIANFKNNYFKKHHRTAGSSSSYILHRKLNKSIQEADWPSRLAFCVIWTIKSLYFTYSHSYSFVLWITVICCYSLSFLLLVVIRCHSLSLAIPLAVTRCIIRCHLLYHSIPLVVPLLVTRCNTRCHSLSLVVTRCTTRLSFYKRSLFYNFFLFDIIYN